MITEFDPVTHIGKVDGVEWPSVTQLLQQFNLIDYSRVPNDVLEAARIRGTRVHAATVMVDDCTLDEEHFNKSFPDCVPYLDAYRKFREIENFEPEHKEQRYFSSKWRFHGAPDESGSHLCKFGGMPAIVEYKTTFAMYPSAGAQTAAYAMLLEECLGIKIKKRFGLLLKKTGNYELIQFKDPTDFNDFQACVYLHWRAREKYNYKGEIYAND